MKKRCLFICVFLFICVQLNVECQVCTRSVKKFVPVRKTFYRTYVATYKKANCWFRCTRTMIKSYIEHRDIIDSRRETVKYCCSGYIRNDTVSDKDIKCIPKCSTKCENGYCKEPGKCECNDGYLADLIIPHLCLPTCKPSCVHGTCIKPNVCKCNFGYELRDGICQPVCTEPCVNAVCGAPETCICHSGFRMLENNVCSPYCSSGCTNGKCISPETCSCQPGWRLTTPSTCEPICSRPCGNGTCTKPDTCDCYKGYEADLNGTSSVCVPECVNCGGVCVAPGVCVCHPPYIAAAVRDDGGECDCIYNCSDANKMCDRTICYIPTTTTSTTSISTTTTPTTIPSTTTEIDDTTIENLDISISTTETTEITDPNSISSTSNDNNRTELFDIIIENSTLYTSYVTIPGNIDVKFNITKEAIHKTSSLTLWMLIAIALTILNSMLIIIILFIKRKALYKYCKGDSYAVKAEVSTTEVSEQFDFNQIKFSSIMRKKQNEEREQEECNNKA
ncbi:protein draper-like isoform X1 [Galleria mellonella]|uniref:Protein draper-like isoform X1 n=1 Tax=Galleria mellonella TaxID=7137 RepID=A0A6J1X4H3_GALME|nr:protein draper-like isoform X1 [Galleria mellonella]